MQTISAHSCSKSLRWRSCTLKLRSWDWAVDIITGSFWACEVDKCVTSSVQVGELASYKRAPTAAINRWCDLRGKFRTVVHRCIVIHIIISAQHPSKIAWVRPWDPKSFAYSRTNLCSTSWRSVEAKSSFKNSGEKSSCLSSEIRCDISHHTTTETTQDTCWWV